MGTLHHAALGITLMLLVGACTPSAPEPSSGTATHYPIPPRAADDTPDTRSEPGPQFHGYDCRDNCSGHEAGYAWAERKGITDPDDCSGNSDSFVEGCIAYAEEGE